MDKIIIPQTELLELKETLDGFNNVLLEIGRLEMQKSACINHANELSAAADAILKYLVKKHGFEGTINFETGEYIPA
mgnify:CR=1 FL=1